MVVNKDDHGQNRRLNQSWYGSGPSTGRIGSGQMIINAKMQDIKNRYMQITE